MTHPLKHHIEYLLLRLLGAIIRLLPLRLALLLGWLLAATGHHLIRFRRTEARRRITHVLGDELTPKQINHIAWISWRNLCFNAIELLRLNRLTRENFPANETIHPLIDTVKEALEKSPSGLILSTAHMGNWELAGIGIDLHQLPIFSIARRQKNPLTDAYLNRTRNSFNMDVLLNDNHVVREIIRRLKKKQILALLPDVRNPRPAQPVSFLNGTANLGHGVAAFARQCNCPIQPVITHRIGWSQHTYTLLPPITPDPTIEKEVDQQRIMEQLMAQLTTAIKANPEQYFWYNKRWVLDPL
jgi:KDO2-lipid IV(A) lauroyltransferase